MFKSIIVIQRVAFLTSRCLGDMLHNQRKAYFLHILRLPFISTLVIYGNRRFTQT